MVIEFYNVWVLNFLHCGNLSLNCFPFGGIIQLVLLVSFDGHLLPGLLVLPQFYIGISSFSEGSDHLVVFNLLLCEVLSTSRLFLHLHVD